MATPESSGLYPPILESYAPVFTGDICIVYFQLSPYMENKIYNLEVIINDQKRNISVLKDKASLKVTPKKVTEGNGVLANQYYFTIESSQLQQGFQLNTFYRVQARIIDSGVESEWSKVCLVRRIANFNLLLAGTSFSVPYIELSGRFQFVEEEGVKELIETIKTVNISFFDSKGAALTGTEILLNQDQYLNDNSFSYQVPLKLENGTYKLRIEAETKNGAIEIFDNIKIVVSYGQSTSIPIATSTLDKENGVINLIVDIENTSANERLRILRSSNMSNFKIWETVHNITLDNAGAQKYSWTDKTIEYGLFYKYTVLQGGQSVQATSEETSPIFANFDDTYLTQQNKQLKVSLNKNISNFTRTISQQKIETIGGKFPFIVRNGHTNYRTFPLSGTISYLGNNEEALFAGEYAESGHHTYNLIEVNMAGMFETKESLYGESKNLYEEYNNQNNISNVNNVYLERRFREKVEEFLNDFNPKLFRSPTEGNLLIQITDVNLTPNNQLGGYIYDFSCTATEIADCTIENFDSKGIQSIGELEDEKIEFVTIKTVEKVGQI